MEASRKHGPFDMRWPCVGRDSTGAAPAPPRLREEEATEALDWEAFSQRHFPGRKRHNSEARTAYATYMQGREWRTTPARLSVVPTEHVPTAVEPLASEEAGTRRLLAAIAAERT